MTKSSGFTLIELLVTLTVAGILLAIAAPAFRTTILNSARDSRTDEFLQAITFARSKAVTLRRSVVMCTAANPMADKPVCASKNGWENGWIIFIDREDGPGSRGVLEDLDADSNRDGDRSELDADLNGDGGVNASDAIIQRRERLITSKEAQLPIQSRFSLRGNRPVRDKIAFKAGGLVNGVAGSIVACDSREFKEHARIIVIAAPGGRTQILSPDDPRARSLSVRDCLRS